MTEMNSTGPICEYQRFGHLMLRLFLMVIVMGMICSLGTLGNVLAAAVYVRRGISSPSNLYLVALAICDTGVLVCSFLLYSVEVLYDVVQSFFLYKTWFFYVRVVFLFSHFFQWGACYLVILATFERFLNLWRRKLGRFMCQGKRPLFPITASIFLVASFNASKYFETEVVVDENCLEFGRYRLLPGALLKRSDYRNPSKIFYKNFVKTYAKAFESNAKALSVLDFI